MTVLMLRQIYTASVPFSSRVYFTPTPLLCIKIKPEDSQNERAIENLHFYHSWYLYNRNVSGGVVNVFSKRLSVLKEPEKTKMWTRKQLLFMMKQSLFFKPPCKLIISILPAKL